MMEADDLYSVSDKQPNKSPRTTDSNQLILRFCKSPQTSEWFPADKNPYQEQTESGGIQETVSATKHGDLT